MGVYRGVNLVEFGVWMDMGEDIMKVVKGNF